MKKFILILLLFSVIIIFITTEGIMILSDFIQYDISQVSGTVTISLVDEVIDTESNSKSFKVQSNGNLPIYVRAKLIPIVEYFDTIEDDWVITNIPQSDILFDVKALDWIFDEGYYYYNSILYESDKTTFINMSCNVTKPTFIGSEDIRIIVKTILESSQIRNDIWKDRFNITSLPTGVEIFE